MSCWRVLELSEQPDDAQIPQLLVKPVFHADSYILHVTDLSNIWSEELDLDGIVDRASREQSPIEISKQDTTQLAILLDNVMKSLVTSKDVTCRITRGRMESITLHSTIKLPKPLDSLKWKFHLEKRTATTLRNELILPLLVSSHIQNERITDLILTIATKDNALDRLVDQYESSNLDLAAAFPSIGRLKSGRRMIKREQAARHISALQPFDEEVWREETGRLGDSDVTTLGMFQEALSQCNPEVPPQLKLGETQGTWWTAISEQITPAEVTPRSEPKKPAPAPKRGKNVIDSTEDETDDEFETHEHFKTRTILEKPIEAPEELRPHSKSTEREPSEDGSTEDDDDLDAPSTGQQSQNRASQKSPPRTKSPTPEVLPPYITKPKPKGFRMGGQTKKSVVESLSPRQESTKEIPEVAAEQLQGSMLPPSSQIIDSQTNATPKKSRRTFKIGGKGKVGMDGDDSQRSLPPSSQITRMRSPTADPPSSPPPPPDRNVKEPTPVEEVQEETPEEKAERRRAELKRRNEQAAKKQAQTKKKKRF